MKFTLPCVVFVAGGAFASPVPDTDASIEIDSGNAEAEAPSISLPGLPSATPTVDITDTLLDLLKPATQSTPNAPAFNITDTLNALGLLKPTTPAVNITDTLLGLLKPATPSNTTAPTLNVTEILNSLGLLKPASPQQCTKPNQVYNGCGTSCPAKCWQPTPQICNKLCKVGCQCKPGFLLNKAGDCVSPFGCIFDIFSP